ncbi:uncharacterized protein LOC131613207 [Vicia villosa]|uniref:uncharacterized protein LOC131613207 n=1 Tax=Vicia villosa TaxID=3911 RepID=UPI00273AB970|nr:uncharacterized protein LOC131613207 [Vicia villosa]
MNLQPQDRSDIISRVFKIKLDELLCDLTKKHVLGRVVASEIPAKDDDSELYHLVKTHMIHGPCGLANRYGVPYNAYLLKKFQAHINMEWCNQGTSVKYLFKYINKGYDTITAAAVEIDTDENFIVRNIDEIRQYLDCRYVSPSEACWRIFSFPIHGRSPVVARLYFHVEGNNPVYYTDHELNDEVLGKPSVKE